jgi:hypothetical protein
VHKYSLSLTEASQNFEFYFFLTRGIFFTNRSASKESTDFYIINRQKIKAAFFMQFDKFKYETYCMWICRDEAKKILAKQVTSTKIF